LFLATISAPQNLCSEIKENAQHIAPAEGNLLGFVHGRWNSPPLEGWLARRSRSKMGWLIRTGYFLLQNPKSQTDISTIFAPQNLWSEF